LLPPRSRGEQVDDRPETTVMRGSPTRSCEHPRTALRVARWWNAWVAASGVRYCLRWMPMAAWRFPDGGLERYPGAHPRMVSPPPSGPTSACACSSWCVPSCGRAPLV